MAPDLFADVTFLPFAVEVAEEVDAVDNRQSAFFPSRRCNTGASGSPGTAGEVLGMVSSTAQLHRDFAQINCIGLWTNRDSTLLRPNTIPTGRPKGQLNLSLKILTNKEGI